MVQDLKTKIVPFSRIQVSPSRLRRKNIAALREAMHKIRKYGQQRPLIIDPDRRLLTDTASYLALKALDYDFVKVLTLTDPSPATVRALGRVLDCYATINRQAAEFNSALTALSRISRFGIKELILGLWPVVIADTGELSLRVSPTLVSDAGDRTPLTF
jgi:hypothetical protein